MAKAIGSNGRGGLRGSTPAPLVGQSARGKSLASAQSWAGVTQPHLCVAFVPVEAALAWHRGRMGDDELWDYSVPPEWVVCGSVEAALWIRRNRGREAWPVIGELLQTFNPSALVFRSIHPVIDRRCVQFGAEAGFSDSPGKVRYFGRLDDEKGRRFVSHWPGLKGAGPPSKWRRRNPGGSD